MQRFTKKNPGFTCIVCQAEVPPAKQTCRNHCPFCLHSLHLDISPGDRQASCGGVMQAQNYRLQGKKLSLEFKCTKCGCVRWNKAICEDPIQGDDYSKILSLKPW